MGAALEAVTTDTNFIIDPKEKKMNDFDGIDLPLERFVKEYQLAKDEGGFFYPEE
jgi:hypothetical protein